MESINNNGGKEKKKNVTSCVLEEVGGRSNAQTMNLADNGK